VARRGQLAGTCRRVQRPCGGGVARRV